MDLQNLRKAYKDQCTTDSFSVIDTFSTGILSLDMVMNGGLPRGRIVEISGPESSSKTLISLAIAAQVQKQGKCVGLIDAERTTTEKDLIRAGIDISDQTFFYFTPKCGEEALDMMKDCAGTGEFGLLILDSVPYIKPSKSLEKDTGSATMADVARLIGSEQVNLTNAAADNDCTMIFINQVRAKMTGYGGKDTCGGFALKFMYSVRLQNRVSDIKKTGDGVTIESKLLKSKVGAPFQLASIDIDFADVDAVDCYGAFTVELMKLGWITRKGAYYYLSEEKSKIYLDSDTAVSLGQGAKKVRKFFKEHDDVYEMLYKEALTTLGITDKNQ